MNSSLRSGGAKLGLVLAKAKKATRLSALYAICALMSFGNSANAQNITLDGSLGTAGTLTGQDYVIPQNVGQTVGNNLFHSFGQFNLDTGESAGFQSAANIRNILSRVTGGEISSIDGRIFTESPNVNLFLINPAGIVFGPNASIDVGSATRGSFIATTANAIAFGSQGAFVASTAQTDIPLLTIDPSAFLFNQIAAAPVVSQAILQVAPGQSLLLVGGDVSLNGGQLLAPGGRVELGGVADSGNIGLNTNGNELRLSFPDSIPRADVFLNNRADVNVRAGGGGSIAVNAHNLNLAGRSRLRAGIDSGTGSISSIAGDIDINATETINLDGFSFISNALLSRAVGQGGDINITTGSLSLTDGSFVVTSTFGQGDAGSIKIGANHTVSLSNRAHLGTSSLGRGNAGSITIHAGDTVSLEDRAFASTTMERMSTGNGGDINITARSLRVTSGAQLSASTSGQGNAGSVNIRTSETVFFDAGFALSGVEKTGQGNGGTINILAESLFVTNGAQLVTVTHGEGDADSVNIHAHETVSFDGKGSNGFTSGAYSYVNNQAVGHGGNIEIATGSLFVTNGAQLSASTRGQGNAGSVNINALESVSFDAGTVLSNVEATGQGNAGDINIVTGSLAVTNAAELVAATRGQGNAGSVNIRTSETVSFDAGSAFSSVAETALGNAGDINIMTDSLSVTNGAQLGATTKGQGNAGSVNINALNTVSFDGVGSNGFPSAALSSVESGTLGQAQDINITTGSLRITDGAVLGARTTGQGDGGNIIVNADTLEALNGGQVFTTSFSSGKAGNITLNVTDRIALSGSDPTYFDRLSQFGVSTSLGSASGLFANAAETSTNRGGDLRINTGELIVRDGSQVTVSSEGLGNAGLLLVEAGSVFLDNQGKLTGTTASGMGGNLTLLVEDIILMRNESAIATTAANNGNGGNITISAPFIIAVSSENSDIVANADLGFGGRIDITATGIYGLEFRDKLTPESDINASSNATGKDGIVEINTPDIDPSRGLANLPTELVNAQLDHRCQARGTQATSRFVNTGRGGLPLTPDEISSNTVWEDLRSPTADANTPSDSATVALPRSSTSGAMVEAQGWVKHPDGTVILTAQVPTATLYSSALPPATCY